MHLPIHMVLQLANAACEKYKFPKLIGAELNAMYTTKKIVPPVIRRTETGTLWVDKWYVALQIGDDDVKYLYLTRHHINEEVASYRRVKKLRDNAPSLPADIMEQFRAAYNCMKTTEQYIYFSEDAEALSLGWVSAWREATQKELQRLMIIAEKRSA